MTCAWSGSPWSPPATARSRSPATPTPATAPTSPSSPTSWTSSPPAMPRCSTAGTILTVLGGAVAGVGVAGDGDRAVAGHGQGEPDQAQVIALLLGVAPLGDRGPVVARVDERGEVRHVQREAGQVQAELGDHRLADRPLRGRELGGVQRVHRIPEPAVVRRADGN